MQKVAALSGCGNIVHMQMIAAIMRSFSRASAGLSTRWPHHVAVNPRDIASYNFTNFTVVQDSNLTEDHVSQSSSRSHHDRMITCIQPGN